MHRLTAEHPVSSASHERAIKSRAHAAVVHSRVQIWRANNDLRQITEITPFPDLFPFSQSFPVQTFPAFHPRIVVLVKNERIYDQKYWYIFWIVVIRVSLFSLDVLRFNSFNFMKSTMFVPDWNKSLQKSRLHEESGPKSPSLVRKVETAHNKEVHWTCRCDF